MKETIKKLISAAWFEIFIITIIITNSFLIGVETYTTSYLIKTIQSSTLWIFTIEIILRWIARDSIKSFFKDGWNVFDLSIVLISFIPESLFSDVGMITAIRVLRVFRILRLFRASPEIKLIVAVLFKSFSALIYNGIFFFIFMYLFSVIGVTLFKLPDAKTASPATLEKLYEYKGKAPNAPSIAPDPYGTLDETMFTLFRILTGEDWTDLRYNLRVANELGLIHSSSAVITTYHILWFILSAFLLLNLLVGAILNNYQVIMDEQKAKKNNNTFAPTND